MIGYYLVALGAETNDVNAIMEKRLYEIGTVRKMMNNFYLLRVEEKDTNMRVSIRDKIIGEEKYSAFVLTLTDNLYTAWSFPRDNSNYLKKIIREDLHGTVE